MQEKSVLLICQGLTGGGAEVSMLRLAENFSRRGYQVRIAVLKKAGELLETPLPDIRIDEIGGGRLTCIPRLARYLRSPRPDAIISFMTYTNVVSIIAQILSASARKIVVTEHSVFSRSITIRGRVTKLFYYLVPIVYRWASSIICVSRGVEDDLVSVTRLPRKLLTTIYNPVVTEDLLARSLEPADHPWLLEKTCPVILAVGRLERAKNYPMMFEALRRLRERFDCKLIVLGEGNLRGKLEAEIAQLHLSHSIDLLGFRANPMAFMRQADVFALSSDWEGLSNVLIEAMAVGCAVVSTDAPYGPREVLQNGHFGRLVPVGDSAAFAQALEDTLRQPGDPERRKEWARSFTVDACADRYLQLAGLT
jgi:glycosyltransferase involved in cell wall biosynthesis